MQYTPPFVEWLFSTIRAIFDAKYYEFLMYDDFPGANSRFPDFVYSWLGNFLIDSEERNVRHIEFFE